MGSRQVLGMFYARPGEPKDSVVMEEPGLRVIWKVGPAGFVVRSRVTPGFRLECLEGWNRYEMSGGDRLGVESRPPVPGGTGAAEGRAGERVVSSQGHPSCDRSPWTSFRIFINEPLLCIRKSQHKIIQDISWSRVW